MKSRKNIQGSQRSSLVTAPTLYDGLIAPARPALLLCTRSGRRPTRITMGVQTS